MITIHVGFLKTGTTLLQNHLFPNHPQISHFHQPDELNDLIYQGNEVYDPEPLKGLFDKFRSQTNRNIVVSHEGLSSYETNIGLKAERLHEVFARHESPQILFVLRNQFSSMQSYYKQNGSRTFLISRKYDNVKWRKWLRYHLKSYHQDWKYPSMLRYDEVITHFEKIFGPDKIHVLLYETLKNDLRLYAQQLGRIIDINENEIIDLIGNERENVGPTHIYGGRIPLLGRFRKKQDDLKFGEYRSVVHDLFAEGNERLRIRYGLPMKEFDYPLSL